MPFPKPNAGIPGQPAASGQLRLVHHGPANPVHDDDVNAQRNNKLNTTKTWNPGTALRLKYVPLKSAPFPAGQEVLDV